MKHDIEYPVKAFIGAEVTVKRARTRVAPFIDAAPSHAPKVLHFPYRRDEKPGLDDPRGFD
jgi:hypothetical protein